MVETHGRVNALPNASKLRAPVITDRCVRRPRLVALLDEVTDAPLTVVVAPAGSGKTTLVADWVAEAADPAAWLALDETDRDVRQFWRSVVAALQTLVPEAGEPALALLQPGGRPADVVSALLDELESLDRPRSLFVLDDAHLVADLGRVMNSLALFLSHLPSWLHVVLLSRWDPPLRLERLRARGHLGEVRYDQLRFEADEGSSMLRNLDLTMPDDRLVEVVARNDGWAAGLQLAALSTRSAHPESSMTTVAPGDLLVHDYVVREVLDAETPELVEALFDVSVVDGVSAGLAKALTGRTDACDLLDQAEAHGLFVSRLGLGGYRLHPLFRGVLVAELLNREPERLAEQHVRAARCYEAENETVAALHHWLEAGQYPDALRLLAEKQFELYDEGLEQTIAKTLASVPEHLARENGDAQLQFAWCHLTVDRRRFLELTSQLSWWTAHTSAPDALFRTRVAMLEATAATVEGRWADSEAQLYKIVAELGDAWLGDPYCRNVWNIRARNRAMAERWEDTSDDAREIEFSVGRDPERYVSFQGTAALGQAIAGRPVDALRIAAGVRRVATISGMTFLRTEVALAEAIAHRELGERTRALAILDELAEAPSEALLYCRVLALIALTELRLDGGDVRKAERSLAAAADLSRAETFNAPVHDWVARTHASLALVRDDRSDAATWANAIADPFWRSLTTARVLLASGDKTAALTMVESADPSCPRHEVVVRLVRARVLTDRSAALEEVSAAVDIATRCGMLQTVASEGSEVLELVERVVNTPADWLDRLRRSATPTRRYEERQPDELIEPLTERERDVLRFLPSRLTLREIADELYVSVNTVKFHLRLIYRKLGVSSRVEAAEAARRMLSITQSPQ